MKTKKARLAIRLLVLILTLASHDLHATTTLNYDWKIKADNQIVPKSSLETLWKGIASPGLHKIAVTYEKSFDLEQVNPNKEYTIIVPPSWLAYRITINGQELKDSFISVKVRAEIYAHRFFRAPPGLLKKENRITIASEGSQLLGGFRGPAIVITDDQAVINSFLVQKFFNNDIYTFFIGCSFILGILYLGIAIYFRAYRLGYFCLGIGSLSIIPHLLLTTNFYAILVDNYENVFRFHLLFQTISWPCYSFFFSLNIPSFKDWVISKNKRSLFVYISIFYSMVLAAAVLLPLNLFAGIVAPIIFASINLGSPFGIYVMRKNPLFFLLSSVGYVICFLAFLSEVFSLNVYYLGYSSTLFSISGFYLLFLDFTKFYNRSRSASEMSFAGMPDSVSAVIDPMFNYSESTSKIRKTLDGNAHMFTIFIDIIGWGEMAADLNLDALTGARNEAFRRFSRVFKPFGIEFVKTIGDCAHFCSGFPFSKHILPETELAANILRGISTLLDSIDKINVELGERNLPCVGIKVSAAYGHCGHGFDGTDDKFRFDITGDCVNKAKRFEEKMDKEFYNKYGKNVACVEETILKMAMNKASDVISRFSESMVISEKHGRFQYNVRIARQYSAFDVQKTKELMNNMFGKHAHPTTTGFVQTKSLKKKTGT